jgi:Autoinducer binding domain
MAIDQPEENLTKALSIIDNTPEMDKVVDRLREVLEVDHVVYSMARPSAGLYIHLTYPGSWIKRYMNRGYADVDPIAREGNQRLSRSIGMN